MIITLDDLKELDEYRDMDDAKCIRKIKAIESIVRSYTNNSFQNRHVRFSCKSEGSMLDFVHPFLKAGDEVQITQSPNDGLYDVVEIGEWYTLIDGDLYAVSHNLVTNVNGIITILDYGKP